MENTSAYVSEDGEVVGGNASERALIKYVSEDERLKLKKLGVEEVNDILFDSKRKFSATQVHCKTIVPGIESSNMTLVKGAPEILLEHSKFYFEGDKKVPFSNLEEINKYLDDLAGQGIRLIALGISPESITDEESIPENISLVGIIGIRDDIREESFASIDEVQKAGIQVVMITGDRRGTAASIAKEINLLKEDTDRILVSSELNEKSDEELEKILPNIRVIARALPTDKSRLVRLSKRAGKVVGMTGDGVNDSAALKQADVGVAMGSGSEVSKEAGDIVILDDNFNSINNAIRYGRTIFKSIRKFVVFQLSINVAAVTTALIGPLIGIDFPLTIIQLLWINMIMDTLGAIAFGGEPALQRYLREPPVNRDENILTADMKSSILTSGLYITAFSVFFLKWPGMPELFVRNGVPNEEAFLTGFFNLFIFMIIMNAFNVRTEKINLFDHIKENKKFLSIMGAIAILQISFTYIGGTLLRTTGLLLSEWLIIVALALTIIPIDMLRKLIFRSTSNSLAANR
jgi:calcium-translocating P-type ATPase